MHILTHSTWNYNCICLQVQIVGDCVDTLYSVKHDGSVRTAEPVIVAGAHRPDNSCGDSHAVCAGIRERLLLLSSLHQAVHILTFANIVLFT